MRKIVVTEFVALDGVMQDPAWTFPYWGDDIAEFKFNELFASDSMLLGRVTYEGFAQAWPGRTDEKGYADRFNSMPKHVVSTTLKNPEWNNSSVIGADVVDEITKLKRQDGQNIIVHGSCTLVQTLIQHDLVDTYNLLVYPIIVGTGKRLFGDLKQTPLKLVSSQQFASGVMGLVYEADRDRKKS